MTDGLSVCFFCVHLCSAGLEREDVQSLLESEDVWRVGEGGSVEFRTSKEEFQRLKKDLSSCNEVANVESIVRKEEIWIKVRKGINRTSQQWFEEYVSLIFAMYNVANADWYCSTSIPISLNGTKNLQPTILN